MDEGDSDDLIDRFGQVIKRQGKVQKEVRVCGHKGRGVGRGQQESRILTEIQEGHGVRGSPKSDEAIAQYVTFLFEQKDVDQKGLIGKGANSPVAIVCR